MLRGAGFQGPGPRGGKLSLRRKRPLVIEGGGVEGERERQGACASIQEQGAWMMLLRALEPHLEETVNLPVFLPKSSQTAKPQAEPEAFNARTKEFRWFPFPVYQRQGAKGNNLKKHRKSENGTAGLMEREKYEGGRAKVISPVPEQKSSAASEVSKMNFSIKYSTLLDCGEKFGTCQDAQNLSLTSAESHQKGFGKRWEKCSLQDGAESRRENGRGNPSNDDTLVQGGSSLNECASTLPLQDPRPAGFGGQGKTEHPSEDTPTLEKCPLCQMRFPGTWSGLEIDSHLSQCLSESADDAMW